MSIKQIDTLPPEPESKSRRKMLREDLMTAISQRITAFEFEGDYNYKYLASYAREEADSFFRSEIFYPAERVVRKKLKGEYKMSYVFPPSVWVYRNRFIKITNRKGDDRNHVYAQIDYDFADKFVDILEADTRKRYQEVEERKKNHDKIADSKREE